PCPGGCGELAYEPGNLGLFSPLDQYQCGLIPNMKVWFRRASFFDPTAIQVGEFNRNQTFNSSAQGPTTFCPGDSVKLNTMNLGPGVTYQWYLDGVAIPGEDSLTIVAQDIGDYVCVATAGACETIETKPITIVHSTPMPDLGPDRSICTDTGYVLMTANSWATYQWSDGSSGDSLQVDSTGLYSVTVTDVLGCVGSDSVFLTLNPLPTPVIAPGDTVLICQGDSVELDAFDPNWFVYNWSRAGETSSNIFVGTPGDYYVIVHNQFNCSDTSNTVHVDYYPTPALDLGPDQMICEGDSLVLSVGNEWASVIWPDLSTGSSYTVLMPGTYVVHVTDSNGCAAMDSIDVTLQSPPTVSIGSDVTICPGTTVPLIPDGSFSQYVWSNGETSAQITASAGMYQLTVTDANGCEGISNMISVNEHPAVTVPTISGDASGLVATFADNYQWLLDGMAISGANESNWVPEESGVYSVEVADPNNCGPFFSNEIEITLEITADDIPQGFSPNGDGINDRFVIANIGNFQESNLTIFN
ncbi:MAG: gliding motility-associated C-terminal domain-containing protein, partial [Bacteroidota bacterium]